MKARTLSAAAAALLAACTTQPQLPAELPHYPCQRLVNGRVEYFACADQEWLLQQLLRRPEKGASP